MFLVQNTSPFVLCNLLPSSWQAFNHQEYFFFFLFSLPSFFPFFLSPLLIHVVCFLISYLISTSGSNLIIVSFLSFSLSHPLFYFLYFRFFYFFLSSSLQEILLTISNEYTDWSRSSNGATHSSTPSSSSPHPISIIDSINEVLGDALIVSPLIRTGLIHTSSIPSSSNAFTDKGRTFFYNFAFSSPLIQSFVPFTPSSSFGSSSGSSILSSSSPFASNEDESAQSQHTLKCLHGHEIPYLFGQPLLTVNENGGPSPNNQQGSSPNDHAGGSLSKINRIEVNLSESIMTYFSNFVKFGLVKIILCCHLVLLTDHN